METNKKAVIYCRVSTKEQVDEGGSLATQEKLCREYSLKNGYDVAEVFIEQGESAKNAERTQLKRLIDYCTNKRNGVHAVIAYKVDRIARNIDDYRYIRVLLKRYGVEIKSTSEYFEDTPAGRFMENIIANVAQFDNDVRTERSMGGMRDAMREGRYVWNASIGYSNFRSAGKSNIVPNDKAAVVIRLFESVATNKESVEAVRRNLFAEGLSTRSGKLLTRSHCYKILNNELYAGWIIKFGERHKGLYQPLVSEDLFAQVQRVLKKRSHKGFIYQKENPDFPLRRFVSHSSGKKITGAWSKGRHKKYPYYRFIGVSKTDIKKEILEELFKRFIDAYTIKKEHAPYFKQALKDALDAATDREKKERQKLQAYIIELNERQSSLIEKNSRGVISEPILRRQLELIEDKLIEAHSQLLLISDRNENIGELWDIASEFLSSPSKIWTEASFQQKVELQWFEFPKGIIFENGKLRTTEIASIFKLKDTISSQLSSRVPSRGQDNEQSISDKDSEIPLETWNTIARDLSVLAKILRNNSP